MEQKSMKDLQVFINALSPLEKKKLLKKINGKKDNQIEVNNPFPLSKMQELFYFHHQYHAPLCNIPGALVIEGELDVQALEESLNNIIDRHVMLRTKIFQKDDQIFQEVCSIKKFKLNYVDLSKLKNEIYNLELRGIMRSDFKRPFNLTRPPLIRMSLIKKSMTEHVLTICIHHIAADGWSLSVFLEELLKNYTAIKNKVNLKLPELTFQYRHYVEWHNRAKKKIEIDQQLRYWKNQLKDAKQTLDLPTDYARPQHRSGQGNTQTYSLSEALSQEIKAFCSQKKVTLFMFMLSVYATIMYRYSNQEDFLIGTPISLREPAETEQLIGVFLNMIVFRIQPNEKMSFDELLQHVREVTLEGYNNAQCPLSLVIEAVKPDRQMGFASLFQTFITHNNSPAKPIQCGNLTIKPLLDEAGGADADLAFFYLDADKKIVLRIEYATDLFLTDTIMRMLKNIEATIQFSIQNSKTTLREIEIISTEEKDRIQKYSAASDKNRPIEIPGNNCLSLINEMIITSPLRVILSNIKHSITYQQLPYAVSLMRNKLIEYNCAPKTYVGVYLDYSIETVLMFLAIIEHGAIYVPIDLNSSIERIKLILADTELSLIVTTTELSFLLPEHNAQVLAVNDCLNIFEKNKNSNTAALFEAKNFEEDDIAFLIYTSGSTGKPKASMNTHSALSKKLLWKVNTYCGSSEDIMVGTCSLAFDVSIWEMLSAPCSNIEFRIVPFEIRTDPTLLAEYIAKEKVTLFHTVPSVLQLLLECEVFYKSHFLHSVMCIGEVLNPALVNKFYFYFEKAKLYNYYGPSEACVLATARVCPPHEILQRIPIGKPIAANDVFILDKNKNFQPVGVPGEIYIAGTGIGIGYLNRPDLSKEKFVKLFNPEVSAYKTGDFGRWLPSGEIEFLGRADSQVKFNGVRIELEEIEFHIERFSNVVQSIVLFKDINGVKQLHAFIQAKEEIDVLELKDFLKNYLSSSVIPSCFHFVNQIPLNINNKKDRLSLLSMDAEEIPPSLKKSEDGSKSKHLSDCFYTPVWVKHESNCFKDCVFEDDNCLLIVLGIQCFFTEKVVIFLNENNRAYEFIDNAILMSNDFDHILEKIKKHNGKHIILIPGIPETNFDFKSNKEKLAFVNHVQEVLFFGISSFIKKYLNYVNKNVDLEIYAITQCVYNLEKIQNLLIPLQAILIGLLQAFTEEHSGVSHKIIDTRWHEAANIKDCLQSFSKAPSNTLLSLRDGILLEKIYKSSPVPAFVNGSAALSDDDTYLFIGFGGIAMELAEYLVSTVRCTLIILTKNIDFTPIKLARYNEIAKKAKNIDLFQVDITSEDSLENAFHSLSNKKVKISGVINSSGSFQSKTIRESTFQEWQRVLMPKVQGSILLQDKIQSIKLKFNYYFSSSTTLDYTAGTCAYFSANLFVDFFSNQQSLCFSSVRNIKWGMWKDIGMSNEERIPNPSDEFNYFRENFSFPLDEGIQAFRVALVRDTPELLITAEPVASSSFEKDFFLESNKNLKNDSEIADLLLKTDSELSKKMTDIWKEVLRVEAVDLHSDFFEIGGHSLMAAQLVNKINKALGCALKLKDLFQNPTISSLLISIKK